MVENEIQYLRWSEFQQMAPTILRLEIDRLGGLIAASDDEEFRNPLVKARYELERFIACVPGSDKDAVVEACGPMLEAALLNVALVAPTEAATAETLAYVADRLTYVHDRIRLIY